MFCEKCGKEIPDDAVVCVSCGRAIQPIKDTLPQIDRQVKRANLGLLLGAVISCFVIFFIAIGVLARAAVEEGMAVIGGGTILLAVAAGIFAEVLFCIYVYRMWKMIQDGYASTTPGKAVGFLFIPFFNMYWVFRAFSSWAKDYNSFIQRNSIIGAPKVSEGLFLAFSILICISPIPFIARITDLGIIALIPEVVLFFICAVKICKAINFFVGKSELVRLGGV